MYRRIAAGVKAEPLAAALCPARRPLGEVAPTAVNLYTSLLKMAKGVFKIPLILVLLH